MSDIINFVNSCLMQTILNMSLICSVSVTCLLIMPAPTLPQRGGCVSLRHSPAPPSHISTQISFAPIILFPSHSTEHIDQELIPAWPSRKSLFKTTIYPCLYVSHFWIPFHTHTQSSHHPTGAMSELNRRLLISRPIIVKFKFLTTKSFFHWQQLKPNGLVMARMYHCYHQTNFHLFTHLSFWTKPPPGLGVGRR